MADVLPTKAQATKAAKEEQLADAIRHRTEQLECADTSIARLREALQSARAKAIEQERFISHLAGFYEEVDKLAKGKALFPATDMIVENANSIIRDAKAIIDGDIYIDRLKEFVAAGDNPVYPDILMAARTIQQANGRFTTTLEDRRKKLAHAIREAETIKCALEFFVEDQGHVASKEEVELNIKTPAAIWFNDSDDDDEEGGEELFDFSRLDTLNLGEHLTAALTVADGEE